MRVHRGEGSRLWGVGSGEIRNYSAGSPVSQSINRPLAAPQPRYGSATSAQPRVKRNARPRIRRRRSCCRYFNQGLRFTATFKFDFAIDSHMAALDLDPGCPMCKWGLALAYGQNLNDALVMSLEPEFLAREPLAHEAVSEARSLLEAAGAGDGDGAAALRRERDRALVDALAQKFRPTLAEYELYFVDGLPTELNRAYAEAMGQAAARSEREGWPDHAMVLVLAADAWMNVSPWDCEWGWLGSAVWSLVAPGPSRRLLPGLADRAAPSDRRRRLSGCAGVRLSALGGAKVGRICSVCSCMRTPLRLPRNEARSRGRGWGWGRVRWCLSTSDGDYHGVSRRSSWYPCPEPPSSERA